MLYRQQHRLLLAVLSAMMRGAGRVRSQVPPISDNPAKKILVPVDCLKAACAHLLFAVNVLSYVTLRPKCVFSSFLP